MVLPVRRPWIRTGRREGVCVWHAALLELGTASGHMGGMSQQRLSRYALHHERKGRLSRLVLLDQGRPVAASSRVPTDEVAQWMRRYDIPFTGLLRTGWKPTGDQWVAICRKWFPDLDPELPEGRNETGR